MTAEQVAGGVAGAHADIGGGGRADGQAGERLDEGMDDEVVCSETGAGCVAGTFYKCGFARHFHATDLGGFEFLRKGFLNIL